MTPKKILLIWLHWGKKAIHNKSGWVKVTLPPWRFPGQWVSGLFSRPTSSVDELTQNFINVCNERDCNTFFWSLNNKKVHFHSDLTHRSTLDLLSFISCALLFHKTVNQRQGGYFTFHIHPGHLEKCKTGSSIAVATLATFWGDCKEQNYSWDPFEKEEELEKKFCSSCLPK